MSLRIDEVNERVNLTQREIVDLKATCGEIAKHAGEGINALNGRMDKLQERLSLIQERLSLIIEGLRQFSDSQGIDPDSIIPKES